MEPNEKPRFEVGAILVCVDTQIIRWGVPGMQTGELLDETVGDLNLEKPMTLQVGLSGKNGFVIASDRLVQCRQSLGSPMHSGKSSKIQTFPERGLVVAYAGENPPTSFGYRLRDAWGTKSPDENVKEESEKWFKANPTSHVSRESEIIVAHVGDAALWQILGAGDKATVGQYDRLSTRNSMSLAPFLPEHFYSPESPISTLETLAALTIWYGERQGNTTIRDLDGVTCEDGIIEAWSAEKIAKMKERCELIHATIRGAIVESYAATSASSNSRQS